MKKVLLVIVGFILFASYGWGDNQIETTPEKMLPSFIESHIKIIFEPSLIRERTEPLAMRAPRIPRPMQNISTTCDVTPGNIGGKKLYLYTTGAFDAMDGQDIPMNVTMREWTNGRETATDIKDAVITNLKAIRVAKFLKTYSTFAGPMRSSVKVFSVNFRVHSDSTKIGTELQGCIMREVNTVEFYTHCYEVTTDERRVYPAERNNE